MKKALLYLFYFLLIQFVAQRLVYSVWLLATGHSLAYVGQVFGGDHPEAVSAPMLVTASAVAGAAAIALFIWRRFSVVSPRYFHTRPMGVFFWCAVAAVGTLIPSAGLQELLPELPDLSGETFKMIMSNRYGYFVLCLFVPFAEELVFRGAILRSLLGSLSGRWAAIAVSAVFFAVVHLNPAQMPHAFLMGLLLGWLYSRTGSILPGIAIHWVNNTVAYAVYVLMPYSADMKLTDFFGGNTNNAVLAVIFSLFILIPGIYQLNLQMKPADKRR